MLLTEAMEALVAAASNYRTVIPMNKPLFLFVGKSASGKTTIANMLENEGYKQIASYTTRPPRFEGETGHTFISEEEFDNLKNIMAYTNYNNYRYCTTLEQINDADIYVVDPDGVYTLLDNYSTLRRQVYIIYFDASVYSRINRMLMRDDSDTQIVGRLLTDEATNWMKDLIEINYNHNRVAEIQTIDANSDIQTVYVTVKNLIKLVEEGILND